MPGGFYLAEAKGGAAWLDADTLLLSSAAGGATASGYASTVRLWRRGEAPGAPLFEAEPGDMARPASTTATATGWCSSTTGLLQRPAVPRRPRRPAAAVDLPTDARFVWHAAGWR